MGSKRHLCYTDECFEFSGICALPNPTLTFGFILSTLFGAGFHLIFGGGGRRLALFLMTSWLGFAFGHLAGVLFEINIFNIGVTRFFPAAVSATIALSIAQLLTEASPARRSSRSR